MGLQKHSACIAAALLLGVILSPPSLAQEPEPRFVKLGGTAGVQSYSPENWGIVAAILQNPADHPVTLLATSYFADEPNLQYGREFWIPPNAVRTSWYPVRPPATHSRTATSIQVESMLYDRTDGAERLILGESDKRSHAENLPVNREAWVTGLVPPKPVDFLAGDEAYREGSEVPDDMAVEAAVAVRLTGSAVTRRLRLFEQDPLPPTAESLQHIDQLVISSDRLNDNPAALDAVKGWVHNGGLLWIMVDQLAPAALERLVGEAVDIQLVDRVALSSVKFQDVRPDSSSPAPAPFEFDEPVDFVRVLASGVEVQQTVDGWPASFWKDLGRGKVLFTTLEPRAWVRQRRPKDPRPNDSKFIATRPLERVADRLFAQEEKQDFAVTQLEPLLGEQIGYQIVSRKPVLAVLGAFCAALVVAGVWLFRRQRLESLGWLGPVGALVAASTLISMGMQSKKSAPNTMAVTQLVHAIPGSNDATMTGLAALYHQSESSEEIGAMRGGLITPTLTGMEGTTRRMVWTDREAWHWENLTLPGSAVTLAPFQWSGKIEEPIEAWGTFGPNGFSGTFRRGPLQDCDDAFIMNGVQPGIAVDLDENGGFAARPSQVLAPGQFLADTLLDDEQRRRQLAARMLFPRPTPDNKDATVNTYFFEQPTLLVWADPLDTRFSFPASERHVGSALVQIPLTIERPPAGTNILVPTTFLACTDDGGPAAFRGSGSTYYDRKGYWEEKASAARTWLRFEPPKELLPLEIKRATLSLTIKAPSRELIIEGLSGAELIQLGEKQSPVGTFEFNIDRPEVLRPDANGGFLIGINVGETVADASSGGHANPPVVAKVSDMKWRIDSMKLDVEGVTLEQ